MRELAQLPQGPAMAGGTFPPQLGELLVAEGLLSKNQLDAALEIQRALETPVPLGQILIHWKLITPTQLNLVLTKYKKASPVGEILLRKGLIDQTQLDAALEQQQKSGTRIGHVLVRTGVITDDQLKQALGEQLGLGFLDLDGIALDRSLRRWINRTYAQRHRVIPVSKQGDTLTVVLEDPTNSSVVDDLHTTTGCRIVATTAGAEAFGRAFTRFYVQEVDAPPGPPPQPAQAAPDQPPVESRPALRDGSGSAIRPAVAQPVEPPATPARTPPGPSEESRRALEELRVEYEESRLAHEAATKALRELQERHEALTRQRHEAADAIESLLGRMRSAP
jgi:hypothetical protein